MKAVRARGRWQASWITALFGVAAGAGLIRAAGPGDQQGTFRAAVDLIAVDVQVVDRDGRPIRTLGPADFEVSIDGRRRRVVSADFLQYAPSDVAPATRPSAGGAVATNVWPTSDPGRVIIVAVDVGSFGVGASRDVMIAARSFVARLQPNDLVGLYAYPLGPKLNPTADHAAIRRGLDVIVGQSLPMRTEFHLRPSEVIDIIAESSAATPSAPTLAPGTAAGRGVATAPPTQSETIRRVQARENCPDVRCVNRIRFEAMSTANDMEAKISHSLGGLRTLLHSLASFPGRKTLVLLSAGMVVSDRPGGRPDVSGIERTLAQDVALANTAVYTLHIDSTALSTYSAENDRGDRMSNRDRDGALSGRWLEIFSGASGGTLLRVLVGPGESAFDRVLRETSAYYLLGVEPIDADRDGRTRQLRVKVDERGATVRSRTWVALPKK